MYRSIKQQNNLNNRAYSNANASALQANYGAECVYCREVYVNKKKQTGYVCKDCCKNIFR
jgi:hypothetical protein